MQEALKERIRDFGLSEDEEEYILSRDKEIIARLISISEDDVLKEIVYSLVDEDIIEVNYSDEVTLTFINACVYNFPYEASIYEVLLTQKGQDEEQIITELKLLAKVKDKEKIKYILSLYELKDLPLRNEFAEEALNSKTIYGAHKIEAMVNFYNEKVKEKPYYYLEVAKIVSNIKDSGLATCVIDFIVNIAYQEWVDKNNCLQEIASKFRQATTFFHLHFISELFKLVNEDSSILQIENIFKGVDLISKCPERFQAETIWKYFKNCLEKNITPDLTKAQTFLNIKNDNTAFFVDEVLEEDSKRSTDTLIDTIDILNNSHHDYNFEYASALLKYPSHLEYRLSAAQIINEVTEEEKIHIIGFILGEEGPYSLEIAAIGNTLYDKGELEALKLLSHNHILNEIGVSILMARIIGKATDYNYDIVALYEILNKEDHKEKVINALMKELRSDIVSDPSLVADILNRVLGTTINANFALVEDKETKKENKTILNKVLTKFKKSKQN